MIHKGSYNYGILKIREIQGWTRLKPEGKEEMQIGSWKLGYTRLRMGLIDLTETI